jgi:hypothetical protein
MTKLMSELAAWLSEQALKGCTRVELRRRGLGGAPETLREWALSTLDASALASELREDANRRYRDGAVWGSLYVVAEPDVIVHARMELRVLTPDF